MMFGFEFYIREETLGVRLWNSFIRICDITPDYSRDPWHSFGFSYNERALHLRWGKKTKVIWMPWDFGSNIRHEVQNEQGELVPASDVREGIARRALIKSGIKPSSVWNLNIPDGRKMYESQYRYTLCNGEIQERTAKYYVDEREWRWRIFHPFAIGPKKLHRCISVEFDAEVGERTGSWKGGVLGCGYEMLLGESPEQALKRMERDRKFT